MLLSHVPDRAIVSDTSNIPPKCWYLLCHHKNPKDMAPIRGLYMFPLWNAMSSLSVALPSSTLTVAQVGFVLMLLVYAWGSWDGL